MIKIKILIISIFSFTIACSPQYKTNITIEELNRNDSIINIDLDVPSELESFYSSSFLKKVHPIILETNRESLIGSVSKIMTYKDYIIILDNNITNSIFVFDRQGKFIRKIGSMGGGPEEYSKLSDFTINEEEGLIYLLDRDLQKIQVYDMLTGNFKDSEKIQDNSIYSYYIHYFNGKLYADANNMIDMENPYMLREINLKTGREVICWLPNSRYNKGITGKLGPHQYEILNNPFHSSYAGTKFFQSYMDTIISISDKGLSPSLVISSNNIVDKELINDSRKQDSGHSSLYKSGKILGIIDFTETPHLILLSYQEGLLLRTVVYNKANNSVSKHRVILDDLTFKINEEKHEMGMIIPFVYADKKGLYGYIVPDQIEDLKSLVHTDKLNLPQEEIDKLKKLTIDSNPIILHYEYKD